MSDEDKMLWLFEQIHGVVSGSAYLEVFTPDHFSPEEMRVDVMKEGNLCWSATKTDLMFDYMTKDL